MKNASAGLKAFIPLNRQFWEADLYTVTLLNGTVVRYTTSDQDIVFSGNTFTSSGPFVKRSQLRWGIGLTVDTMDVTILALPAHLVGGIQFLQACAQGLLDAARVQLERVIGATPGDTSLGSVTLFVGNVADIGPGRTGVKMTVRSRTDLLNQPIPRNHYQASCTWMLFDSGCTLSKAAFLVAGTLASGSTALVLKSSSLGQATGYFDLGTITFTSGANSGISATVKSFVAGAPAIVNLNVPLPNAVAPGDGFNIFPGCDKTKPTCINKFSNGVNFLAERFVPVPETALVFMLSLGLFKILCALSPCLFT